ncbi:SPOR domain-containing protein [Marinomonas agarivorans]|nr:SPOR domain-containing protein [Marinomonas agarivorans]
MKWLFFLLVLLNIGSVTWYSLQSQSSEISDEIYAPPTSGNIFTLDEMLELGDKFQQPKTVVEKLDISLEGNKLDPAPILKKEPTSTQKEKDVTVKLVCPTIYFEKEQEKLSILNKLQSKEFVIKEYQTSGEREKFWVYIDAPEKREQAINIVDQLKLKGVDSFIINRGEMKNRISLGLYSTAATANAEKNRIAKQSGLIVKVFEHTRNVPLSVLEFEEGVTENEWRKFLSSLDLNKMMIKLEKNSC